MNLKETIRRILREDDYSPAGKEIIPNKIVVHKSNPMFRDNILKDGLRAKSGECYRIYVGYGTKCKPAIFATNSINKRAWFDSTYDDDIWEINTEMIPDVKWYKDRHFESRSKHIVTFQDIPKEALTLKYEGMGSGDVEKWGKDSLNLYESIKRILREETNDKMVDLVRGSINKIGLDSTLKVFGGYDVVAEYGDIITKKEKIQYIVNVCEELGSGISFNEIGDKPIPYNETKTEYSEIAHIGEFGVYVDVWGGYDNQSFIREDKVSYNKLNDKILDDIFRVSLEIANHNDINLQENYTPWVKRRMDMVRKSEREASHYMMKIFKHRVEKSGRFNKEDFIHTYFSVMMDNLHGHLSNWGSEDFDYDGVLNQLKESFTEHAEELWKHLNK